MRSTITVMVARMSTETNRFTLYLFFLVDVVMEVMVQKRSMQQISAVKYMTIVMVELLEDSLVVHRNWLLMLGQD